MTAIMLCDHQLDPRLRKRFKWIESIFGECSAFVDKKRGLHFCAVEQVEYDLQNLKLTDLLHSKLIYVSGAKIVFTMFFYFLLIRCLNKTVVYEIPDLPLRKGSWVLNYVKSSVFKFVVFILFKNIVVTSDAFKKRLPKKKNYLVCENLPSVDFIDQENMATEIGRKKIFDVVFIGALRYLSQMKMLIRYAVEKNYRICFNGGPSDVQRELEAYALDQGSNGLVEFGGEFNQSEIASLYSTAKFIFSVYDSSQENVKLALPNKLYESMLFEKPIIVARNTYLAVKVSENNAGFSVCSQSYESFSADMNVGMKIEYLVDKTSILNKIYASENEFSVWIESI